jgi:mannose-6-phosphate isomerase-like protein (cupin superfamily)
MKSSGSAHCPSTEDGRVCVHAVPAVTRSAPGCEHWSYVIKGKVSYNVGDRGETFEAGEAYYVPPGHTPMMHAGTELVEFSPTDGLQRTFEVVTKTMEGAGG